MPLNNWPTAKLHKIVKSKKGKKPKLLDVKQFPGSVEYIDIEAFEKGIIKQYADVASSNLCVETDILVVWDGARFGLIGSSQKGAIGSTLMCLSPVGVNRLYLRYFLELMYPVIQQNPKGMATPHVNADLFWNMDIPLPTEDIQRQIVERLSVILPKVRQVKARLETIPILLKKFRQCVLSAACSGQLTESWRNFDHPDYLPMKITDLIESIKYGTAAKCSKEPIGVPILRIPNIQGGFVDSSNLKYAELDEVEKNSLELSEGDLLLVRSNGSVDLVGRTALVRSEDTQYGYAGYLMRLRPNKDLVCPEFLNYCFQSYDMRLQIQLPARSTTGVHNINSTEVKNLELNVPPLDEQQEIVRIINLLYSIADSMESKYQKAMARIDKIEQSILSKTFCSGLRKV